MKSGIYLLTWGIHRCYVGQSVDINHRYKTHLDKMMANKHTVKVQDCYDRWGVPRCEVVTLCHPDHLDVLESYWIHHYLERWGNKLVNTTIPEKPEGSEVLKSHSQLLEYSTGELLAHIVDCQAEGLRYQAEINNLRAEGLILPGELDRLYSLEKKVSYWKSQSWWYRLWNGYS